jgi:ribosomal-protein-alanine N-acetyltransferase
MANLDAPLRTERLDLEPLRVVHARELRDRLSDPELYRFIEEAPPASLAALEDRYRALERRGPADGSAIWLNYVCRERATREVAGLVQATLAAGEPALIAYVFFRSGQGRGLAREGCRALLASLVTDWGQSIVEATVERDNARSIALLDALGFAHVATSGSELRYRRT